MATPISVLLVDDSPAFLRAASRFLSEQASDVVLLRSVARAAEGLEQARELRPDVVVVDLAMPELPGLELIPRLRAQQPGVGIVALTLLDTDAYRQAALAAGADVFVGKAALGSDFLPAIRRAAGGRSRTEPPR